jgi:hypothetical protein
VDKYPRIIYPHEPLSTLVFFIILDDIRMEEKKEKK